MSKIYPRCPIYTQNTEAGPAGPKPGPNPAQARGRARAGDRAAPGFGRAWAGPGRPWYFLRISWVSCLYPYILVYFLVYSWFMFGISFLWCISFGKLFALSEPTYHLAQRLQNMVRGSKYCRFWGWPILKLLQI